jgi:molybdenum cofactor cytidylyltransferase
LVKTLGAAGVTEGCVVTGETHDAMHTAVPASPFPWIRNPDPAAGRLGSLQIGLRACAAGVDILLWPVDRPLASAETVRALVQAAETAAGTTTIVPESAGRRGHPIVFRHGLRETLLAAPADANLREILKAADATRIVVPVPDEGIHFDLDTEEAYAAALHWWQSRRT